MTGPKLSKGASDRLLNLLYSTTLVEIANKTPLVTKFIHDHQPSSLNATQPPHKSILDDLMTYDWNQKPFVQAEVDLPKVPSTAIHSNILKFRCKNNFISGETFQNLYPIKRERKYQLSSQAEEKNGVKVDVVKARNPLDLQPTGVYYLLFKSFTHAAAYWLETLGKVTNGFDLRLEFTKLEKKDLDLISSPYLFNSYTPSKEGAKISPDDLYAELPVARTRYNSLLMQYELLELDRSNNTKTEDKLVYNIDSLIEFVNHSSRQSTVLVKNLPFGLSKHSLPKLLWDYDLEMHHLNGNLSNSIATIIKDPVNQVHLTLIKFADNANARRFVRSFHGRIWDTGIQTAKEKKLYEPILCEVVD